WSFLKIVRSRLTVKPVVFKSQPLEAAVVAPRLLSWSKPGIDGWRRESHGSWRLPRSRIKTHGLGAFGAQRGAKRYLGHSEPARKKEGREGTKCFAPKRPQAGFSFLSKSRPLSLP